MLLEQILSSFVKLFVVCENIFNLYSNYCGVEQTIVQSKKVKKKKKKKIQFQHILMKRVYFGLR